LASKARVSREPDGALTGAVHISTPQKEPECRDHSVTVHSNLSADCQHIVSGYGHARRVSLGLCLVDAPVGFRSL
jgi:hypothetical protein